MEEREGTALAGREEILRFYTRVMRGQLEDVPSAVTNRLRAAGALEKGLEEGRMAGTLSRLDALLEELRRADDGKTA